jgi:AraC family transcriptional regulator
VSGPDRVEYEKRVNRVIDHILRHLGEELSLSGLAGVAAFSPFHFHRVFKATTGETLFSFIQRLRIERAAIALTAHPDQSVLEVALDHGFSSAATFARAFGAHFDMSATAWRGGGAARWSARHRPERNPGKQLRKRGKARRAPRSDTPRKRTEEGAMSIQIRELPPYHVAYMRYVGPYGPHGIPELWIKFQKWMEARGLATDTAIKLGVGHDDPGITAAEKCRYDACVVVPPDFPPD